MSQALSDVSFSSGMGRHKYGNNATQFTADGRLITSDEDKDYRVNPRDVASATDFRSHDRQRAPERYGRDGRDFATTPRDYNREPYRERPREERDYIRKPSPPIDYTRDSRDWVKPNYDNTSGDSPRGYESAPVYGRTLPLPSHRDHGPPVRRHDDYRPRSREDYRPTSRGDYGTRSRDNYHGKSHYDRSIQSQDWRMPFLGEPNYDKTGLISQRNYGGKHGMLARTTTRRKSPKPFSWFFIVVGALLLACALVNILLCIEYYYFCFFWISVVTIELGVVGLIHRGQYKGTCPNLYYIGSGLLVMLAAMAGTALVLWKYVPQLKDLTARSNLTAYVVAVSELDAKPVVTSLNTELRVWLCLGFDSAALVLIVADYFSLYALIKVANRYWTRRNIVTKSVSPFCRPQLFNPFMEMIWGEALILAGIITVFACEGTLWHTYWSPVWTGVFIIFTGGVGSWAAKNPYRTMTGILGVIFNFLAAAVCSVCIVMCVLGFKENIESIINAKGVQSVTTDKIYASLIFFALAIALALICFFYCLGLVVRFGYYMTRSPGYDRDTFTSGSRSETTATTVSTVRGRYGYNGRDPPLPTRTNHNNGFFNRRWR